MLHILDYIVKLIGRRVERKRSMIYDIFFKSLHFRNIIILV